MHTMNTCTVPATTALRRAFDSRASADSICASTFDLGTTCWWPAWTAVNHAPCAWFSIGPRQRHVNLLCVGAYGGKFRRSFRQDEASLPGRPICLPQLFRSKCCSMM